MPDIGAPELIIIAVIVLLLFGPGKAADLGGSLGKSIREFRKATHEDEGTPTQTPALSAATGSNGTENQPVAGARFCIECGSQAHDGQKFCMNCGKPLAVPAN
jgi:sec-independent protein translocase protein TatA